MNTADLINELGLGGIEYVVHFDTPNQMQRAAMSLMKCHPHHFIILPDQRFGLAVSERGARCLVEGNLLP